jgi:hypothetical protein
MRQITQKAAKAFFKAEKFSKSNTKVEVLPNVTILKLHNNPIAYLYNDPQKTLSITAAGWLTNTTKERLNGIGANIHQKNFVWYLDGKEWDGKLIDIKHLKT